MGINLQDPANDQVDGGSDQDGASAVQVAVRVRPFLPSEAGSSLCVDVLPNSDVSDNGATGALRPSDADSKITCNQALRIGGESGPTFTFDRALPGDATQRQVYASCVSPLVQSCLRGYNATTLAYGQTGSGKTYTILGPSSSAALEDSNETDALEESSAGVIPRALRELFGKLDSLRREAQSPGGQHAGEDAVEESSEEGIPESRPGTPQQDDGGGGRTPAPYEYEVRVQFLELYGEEIRDLLSSGSNKLTIRDGGAGVEPEVIGATETRVTSADEALLCLTRGMLRRVTGATAMNAESSRSHAIMSVIVEQTTSVTQDEGGEMMEVQVKRSKFNFVDLAGSERQKRTNAEGKRLKEGIDINKGLLVLGNVISALGDPKKKGKTFVPYRDSKLTRLLKGSLGGNHKTLMIACVSPSSANLEESLNCLRYANRAKNIQNNAVVNLDAGSRLVAELRGQVKSLASELLRVRNGGDADGGPFTVEVLESLAGGADSSGLKVSDAGPEDGENGAALPSAPAARPAEPAHVLNESLAQALREAHAKELSEVEQRASDAETELDRMRVELRQARRELYGTGEELFAAKAEMEYYRLQAQEMNGSHPSSLHTEDARGAAHDGTAVEEADKPLFPDLLGEALAEQMSVPEKSIFVGRIKHYEQEMAELRKQLRAANEQGANTVLAEDFSSRTVLHERQNASTTAKESPSEMNTLGVGTELELDIRNLEPDEFEVSPSKGVIGRATEVIEMEKSELVILQEAKDRARAEDEAFHGGESSDEPSSLQAALQKSQELKNALDEEEKAEQKELTSITNMYLPDSDTEVDVDELNQMRIKIEDHVGHEALPMLGDAEVVGETDKSAVFIRRQQHMDAHLVQLSKSIAAKQELVDQLKLSQSKYENMRGFYEDKLKQMELQLREREAEREALVLELKKMEENNASSSHSFKDVKEKLQAKEKHINSLRKKQHELRSLTKVSSQNETVIGRLRNDISSMKRQKVDLQKQMQKERKTHAAEVQQLKKQAMQRDREATRWKKESDRRKHEAETAQRMAKSRLEEVGKLRNKYREAEKRLRMQTLKRGVMERAGLDAVLVGRRETPNSPTVNSNVAASQRPKRASVKSNAGVDVDSVRDYLDAKIADVGRKEAAADKLAREWEDHFELVARKEELLDQSEEWDQEHLKEELDALDVQIHFKEGRIRQLTRRLGDRPRNNSKRGALAQNSFLEEKEFKTICSGASILASAQATSKILFGMVVRERRRVAALARAASSLDEKVMEAERVVSAKDAALRSLMEEERHERASLAQNQQERILSLMAMVQQEESKEEPNSGSSKSDKGTSVSPRLKTVKSSSSSDSMVLILANERITLLEGQLAELQGEREAKEVYKAKEAETSVSLTKKKQECDNLERQLKSLRSSLRQIRETISHPPTPPSRGALQELKEELNTDGGCMVSDTPEGKSYDDLRIQTEATEEPLLQRMITEIVNEALHPSSRTPRRKTGGKGRRFGRSGGNADSAPVISPRIKRHVELMHSSDSEVDEDEPEWAGDIMADLAMIAEGQMPPSLLKNGQPPSMSKTVGGTVFDRLTDPDNFTGVQKQKVSKVSANERQQRYSKEHSSISANESKSSDSAPRIPKSERKKQKQRSKLPDDNMHKAASPDPAPSLELHQQSDLSPLSNAPETWNSWPQIASEDDCGDTIASDTRSESGRSSEVTNLQTFEHRQTLDRSVFARLQSPSSYTGTHKQVAQHRGNDYSQQDLAGHTGAENTMSAFAKTQFSGDESPDKLPSLSKVPGSGPFPPRHNGVGSEKATTTERNATSEQLSAGKVAEYTQQNVFERLQKTTTRSYAVKKHQTSGRNSFIESEGVSGVSNESDRSVHGSRPSTADSSHSVLSDDATMNLRQGAFETRDVAEYTRQNVFERLQKTTTQSFAVKHQQRSIADHDATEADPVSPTTRAGSDGSVSGSPDDVYCRSGGSG